MGLVRVTVSFRERNFVCDRQSRTTALIAAELLRAFRDLHARPQKHANGRFTASRTVLVTS